MWSSWPACRSRWSITITCSVVSQWTKTWRRESPISSSAVPGNEDIQSLYGGSLMAEIGVPQSGGANTAGKRLGLALVVIAAAQLMIVLDGTIVIVALPTIHRGLHFSTADL